MGWWLIIGDWCRIVSLDTRAFRDALGQFATGVCLVTLVNERGLAQAVTVNSFASVSLDPPLVLWSLQKDSDVYEQYVAAPHFAIAILSSEQQDHSSSYALKDNHELAAEHFTLGENGAPLISEALVNFECHLEQSLDGGDHTILVGRVTRIVEGSPVSPLVFYAGQYRSLE